MDESLKSFQGQADRRFARPDRCDRIALVLQGGGALGAYRAGVYQALQEAGLEPDWVSGVSIGAINGAIIAKATPRTTSSPERRCASTGPAATKIRCGR